MTIADAVFNLLSNDPGVRPIVAARIYPNYNRQDDRIYPLLVYKIENESNYLTNDNAVSGASADIIIAAVTARYSDTAALARLILAAMDGAHGTWAGVKVQGIFSKDDAGTDDVVTEPTTEKILYYVKELSFESRYET